MEEKEEEHDKTVVSKISEKMSYFTSLGLH